MFAPRYFAQTYYAPRYFPPALDGGIVIPDTRLPGGGQSRVPGRGSTYELAKYEDEEIIAVLQAILASRHKN